MELTTFCSTLFHACFIPVYVYKDGALTECFPPQENFTLPTDECVNALQPGEQTVSYYMTSYHSLYGYIRLDETRESIILGPVNYLPYTNEQLFHMRKEFQVPTGKAEEFNTFFQNIPRINSEQFFNILTCVHYALTNNLVPAHQISPIPSAQIESDSAAGKPLTGDSAAVSDNEGSHITDSINKDYFSDSYIFSDSGIQNNSELLEKKLLPYIESGDVDGLQNYFAYMPLNANVGMIASDHLRHTKNTFIVTITLVSRAAIKGGLSTFHAYKLSDTYIRQMESLTTIDDVSALSYHAILDFTERTRSNGLPLKGAGTDMSHVIAYVQEHMNEKITVESIAHDLGFNRSYLSRRFKQELGFDLSPFINRCKLEASKNLLTYTNKSLSDISIYLCFSSQSHFQNLFKKQFGLTPMQYRRQTKK